MMKQQPVFGGICAKLAKLIYAPPIEGVSWGNVPIPAYYRQHLEVKRKADPSLHPNERALLRDSNQSFSQLDSYFLSTELPKFHLPLETKFHL
jgi:hypothetical protein